MPEDGAASHARTRPAHAMRALYRKAVAWLRSRENRKRSRRVWRGAGRVGRAMVALGIVSIAWSEWSQYRRDVDTYRSILVAAYAELMLNDVRLDESLQNLTSGSKSLARPAVDAAVVALSNPMVTTKLRVGLTMYISYMRMGDEMLTLGNVEVGKTPNGIASEIAPRLKYVRSVGTQTGAWFREAFEKRGWKVPVQIVTQPDGNHSFNFDAE
jgi:predicted nucleic acid-binding protein